MTKPAYLIVVWHVNEDERSAKGQVIATAETFGWARHIGRKLGADGWDDISVHHNDARWSPAYDKACGRLEA